MSGARYRTSYGLVRALAALLLILAALAACGPGGQSSQVTPGPTASVRAKVVKAGNGATVVLVPVYINGKGPFTFGLDTGASTSLVNLALARKLHLPTTGASRRESGVNCATTVYGVTLEHWRVGSTSLPPVKAGSTRLAPSNQRGGLEGLLGSDVLSRLGRVTVNYSRQEVTLRSRAGGSGWRKVPIKVVRGNGGATLAFLPVYIHDTGPYAFVLDTGASQSLVDSRLVRKLHVHQLRRTERLSGVSCTTVVHLARISDWRAGKVSLPTTLVTSKSLRTSGTSKLDGLVGSDVYSRFGEITIDYAHQELLIHGAG